ncbi:DUF1684 domain-containing protein [Mesonia sp. K7]|uniref:DUF1684 domain-containing protein n=1 Tax=Mesonia sp. K7 TaxID=2218606 RepID=UPI000DA95E90|nr:DUF1684 domain-containing protein [Mesonia sp. K7]PZD79633.1 hypothetical protein DNG35_01090 [Mesonia sp. K7]
MKRILAFVFLVFITITLQAQNKSKDSLYQETLAFQKEQNSDFKDKEESPLKAKDLKTFKSLDFFAHNPRMVITASFKETPDALPFFMTTSTERKPLYRKYGEATFEIDGEKYTVEIYQNQRLKYDKKYKDHLFLPFNDLTNGVETYGGGRYLDLTIPKGKTIVLNFNKAYNPYCAYNEKYSCPIPPEANFLNFEIKAGVKAFDKLK